MKMLKLSLAILLSMLVGQAQAGNTFANILNHGLVGGAVATAAGTGLYKLTADQDLATTGCSALALGAMQAKEEKVLEGVNWEKTLKIAKEASKPLVGHVIAKSLPYIAKGLKALNVPSFLVPEVKMSANVANLVLLAGITTFKLMGHLQETK
jgi:hypothetical protein